NRCIEFQCIATRRGLGIPKHYPDLETDLVDKNYHCARARDRSGQLAQRLAHQPGVEAYVTVAHLALDLGTRNQATHRLKPQDINSTGANQRVSNLERLLARIGLRYQQFVDIDPEFAGVGRVEGMLCVDEGASSTAALTFGNHVQR